MRARAVILWASVACGALLPVAFLSLQLVFNTIGFTPTRGAILGVTLALLAMLALHGFAWTLCQAAREHWPRVMRFGSAVVAASLVLMPVILLLDALNLMPDSRMSGAAVMAVIAIPIWLTVTAAMLLSGTERGVLRVMRIVASGVAGMTVAVFVASMWAELVATEQEPIPAWVVNEEGEYALLVVTSIAMVVLTCGAGWTMRWVRPERDPTVREFGVECPRCGAEERLKTNGDACSACLLKITVSVV